MATCGSLQHIFDNPIVTPPPLSSCSHGFPMNLFDASTTDMFSEFNLNDKTDSTLSTDHNERHESILKHAKTKILVKPKRSRINMKDMPPPISSYGRRVCFQSYRYNGRLVIREEKILTHEILHAFREDGRLMLRFIPFDDGMEA
ncbi:putative The fantastic four family protein [Helianthus anomalus]